MLRLSASVALAAGFAGLAGCTPPDPPTYPVEGVVKFEGKPLAGFIVEFSSVAEDTKGLSARAETDSLGRFDLQTSFNDKVTTGAVAGKHKVVVVVPPIGRGPAVIPPLALKYQDYNTSGLTFEVTPGGPNKAEVNVGR